jgi:hypothetical protein
MKSILKTIASKLAPSLHSSPQDDAVPQGEKGVAQIGHRAYVGGLWEEIGKLQFDFLVSKGLKPDCYLLDVACGSLRLGVRAIPYLERSHYLGIEKEESLVRAGLEKELDPKIRIEKQPNIIVSDSFEFEKLAQKADYAIAQSLFTHLPPVIINLCFKRLYPSLQAGGVFYATFFRTEQKFENPREPDDFRPFTYTQAEMAGFGEENGFTVNYIGDWNHPRKQVMVEYRKS